MWGSSQRQWGAPLPEVYGSAKIFGSHLVCRPVCDSRLASDVLNADAVMKDAGSTVRHHDHSIHHTGCFTVEQASLRSLPRSPPESHCNYKH